MENLGTTEVGRGPTTSRSHFIICWIWFVGVEKFRNVVRDFRIQSDVSMRADFLSPLSYLFRPRRWQPIAVLVETGSSTAMRQRARWIFPRR
jgi:hypothetical protein